MSDLAYTLIGILGVTLFVSSLFSLPTLWTFQAWEIATSKTRLHILSAAYTSVWSMLYIGGSKYLFNLSITAILWFGVYLLLSLTIVRYVSPSNRKAFYFSTVLGRFAVLGVFEIMILTFRDDELSRVYAELSLLVMCVFLAGLYFLKRSKKKIKLTA